MVTKYQGFVVSQSHWDREWYQTFQQFRVRLIRLMDQVIELLASEQYKSFTTDGHTSMVSDYLEIRPEKLDEIRHLVETNRLRVGPWYVLPDEFLVSAEALVRNLMVGHRQAEIWGKPMKVGYIPDPFGHISQLPAILRGFDIDSALFGRGMGDGGASLPSEFIWDAPSGEQVLAIHMITGYGNFAAIGHKDYDRNWDNDGALDLDDAYTRTKDLLTKMIPKATTRALLFNNGSDHLMAQRELPEVLEYLNSRIPELDLIHGDYQDYLTALREQQPSLPHFRGEMRGARYNNVLPGVLSARMYIKQANQRCQQLLEKYAEPFVAWGAAFSNVQFVPGLLWKAWELLIQNHAHDSICGCSIDQVHREMMPRFDQAAQIATMLSEESTKALTARIDTSARDGQALVVFNPHNWEVRETACCSFNLAESLGDISVVDGEGTVVCSQQRGAWITKEQGKPKVYQHEVTFAANVPPGGYATYWIVPRSGHGTTALSAGKRILENQYLQVELEQDGTMTVLHKATNRRYTDFLTLESGEDVGDEYDYACAPQGHFVRGMEDVTVTVTEQGAQRVTALIEGFMRLPAEIDDQRQARSTRLVDCKVAHFVSLSNDSDSIELKTHFDNQAKDHRLRVHFPLLDETPTVHVEGHYDVLERASDAPDDTNWFQPSVGYNAQHAWVATKDLTLINRGLPEYEVVRTIDGQSLTLTLLRAVGWLSRNDLVSRPHDHAGPGLETPEAQCIGEHTFEYSVKFHSRGWEKERVWQSAHLFNAPLKVVFASQVQGDLAPVGSFVYVTNEDLITTAIRPLEGSDQGFIVRVFNPTTRVQEASIQSLQPIQKIVITNLNEEPLQEFSGQKSYAWKPKQIKTFKVLFSTLAGSGTEAN